MYSAEIAGDEEDEEEAAKNAKLTEEELSAKKAKRSKAVPVAFIHNSSHLYCNIHCCFYAAALCTGKPST